MIAELLMCALLTVVDGDTVKCLPSGQNMRLLGEGVPFVSGTDTPEIGSHAKCIRSGRSGRTARAWLVEMAGVIGSPAALFGLLD